MENPPINQIGRTIELSADENRRILELAEAADASINSFTVETARQESQLEASCRQADEVTAIETTGFMQRLYNLKRKLRSILQIGAILTGAALIGEATSHKLTRYDVTERISEDGQKIFEHQDQQTTDVLNYYSGYKDLPKQMKLQIAKELIHENLTDNPISPFKDKITIEEINDLSLEAVEELLTDSFGFNPEDKPRMSRPIPAPIQTRNNQQWLDTFFPKTEYNDKLYQALWDIEQEAGNPKIRFLGQSKFSAGAVNSLTNRSDVAFYDPFSNTMYLRSPKFFYFEYDQYISEASHGVQWNQKPLSSDIRTVKDCVSSALTALASGQSLWDKYKELYDTPGTIEYEAHSIIEKDLRQKLE